MSTKTPPYVATSPLFSVAARPALWAWYHGWERARRAFLGLSFVVPFKPEGGQ
jgi:hypothetical protein